MLVEDMNMMDMAINQAKLDFTPFLSKFRLKNLNDFLSKLFETTPENSLLIEKQGDLIFF